MKHFLLLHVAGRAALKYFERAFQCCCIHQSGATMRIEILKGSNLFLRPWSSSASRGAAPSALVLHCPEQRGAVSGWGEHHKYQIQLTAVIR